MNKITPQQQFWATKFGDEYTDRNIYSPSALDDLYKKNYGVARSALNNEFLKDLHISTVLEVGCNIGNQLLMLQQQGFTELYGIEINKYAIEKAKESSKNINIIYGSAFDIPFKDNYFDLIFTSGVLIHINPKNIAEALKEIYRVAKKYIWGLEYFSEQHQEIAYRGNQDRLWKGNFVKMYLNQFPDLKLIKQKKYPYKEGGNVDEMFLLGK